jgi:septal ring factor EnvC (AmiA/AmiB activator)
VLGGVSYRCSVFYAAKNQLSTLYPTPTPIQSIVLVFVLKKKLFHPSRSLQDEQNRLREDLRRTETRLSQAAQDCDDFRSRIAGLTAEVSQCDARARSAETRLNEERERVAVVTREVQMRDRELGEAHEDLLAMTKENQMVNARLVETEGRARAAEREREETEGTVWPGKKKKKKLWPVFRQNPDVVAFWNLSAAANPHPLTSIYILIHLFYRSCVAAFVVLVFRFQSAERLSYSAASLSAMTDESASLLASLRSLSQEHAELQRENRRLHEQLQQSMQVRCLGGFAC